MSSCPGLTDWEAFAQDVCNPRRAAELSSHLKACPTCRELLDSVRRNDGWLGSIRPLWRESVFSEDEPSVPLGTRIGQYEIIGLLGSGGMATVYRAQQEHPRRIVALKVIRAGLASRVALRRLLHEAELLGRLEHPGIARIYEAGVAEIGGARQPFFAMELVDGQRLTDFAARRHLSTRQRLELLVKIGEAVQYAHQKGIIHRDLKPGNILVVEEGMEERDKGTKGRRDEEEGSRASRCTSGHEGWKKGTFCSSGQPKILDFGVARSTDADLQATTLRTHIGQLIGTLPYMSPEQATGDPNELDVRSDVYALGVIAYELLAGSLPYDLKDKSITEAVRIIREEEAVPLSSVNKVFRGDLQTIVAKALEKDKTRRYPSASALVADIRRFLNDEPISAHPPSTAYQLTKFAKRHKALVTGVVAVFFTLLLGLAGTSYGFLRATAQRNRALESERVAETRRAEAEVQRNRAVETERVGDRRRVEAESVSQLLGQMLASAIPHSTKGSGYSVLQLLDDFDGELKEQEAKQPEAVATIHATLGVAYRDLGAPERAVKHLSAALDLRRRTLGPEDPKTTRLLLEYGWVLYSKSDYAECERLFREAYTIRSRVRGPRHPDVALAMNGLSDCLRGLGSLEAAEPIAREALAICVDYFGPDHMNTATSQRYLSHVLADLGRYEEAEALRRESISFLRKKNQGDHIAVADGLTQLGRILVAKGDLTAAETAFSESMAMYRTLLDPMHPIALRSLTDWGGLLLAKGEYAKAETYLREAVELTRKVQGELHTDTAHALRLLADLLYHNGDSSGAEPLLRAALDICRTLSLTSTPAVQASLARVLVALGRFQEAEQVAVEVQATLGEGSDRERQSKADIDSSLGLALIGQGKAKEGEPLLRRAIEIVGGIKQVQAWHVARIQSALGECLTALGRYEEAEPLLTESFSTLLQTKGTQFVEAKATRRRLVTLYEAWNRPDDAARFRETLSEVPTDVATVANEGELGQEGAP